MTQTENFTAGLFGKKVERHRINPNGINPFTLCDAGGWCTEDPEQVTCLDCKAIQAGTAERLPEAWL